MDELDQESERLLIYLVGKLPSTVSRRPETFVGYKEAHDALDLPQMRGTWGQSLQVQGLESLSEWLAQRALPAITGIVIDMHTLMPGPGFFTVFGRPPDDFRWWAAEAERSKSFDWSAYIPNATPRIAPNAIDLTPAERQETTTYRILRDTILARRIKQIHDFKCQLCDHVIILPDGTRYAEAHHIQPLGAPHNGPDVIENIICVCPNHHAELDYGVRQLLRSDIRSAPRHQISDEYLRYHNEQVYGFSPFPGRALT